METYTRDQVLEIINRDIKMHEKMISDLPDNKEYVQKSREIYSCIIALEYLRARFENWED